MRRGWLFENAAHHNAVLQHVVIVVAPLAGRAEAEARLRISGVMDFSAQLYGLDDDDCRRQHRSLG
jgi:hypothetical protein